MLGIYKSIFQQIQSDIHRPAANIDFLGHRQLLQLADWNDVERDYPGVTLNELFVKEAEREPDKVALIYQGTQLTYREMDEKTNRLARHLRSVLPCAQTTLRA
jgi:non-ribosomal peptide synthetase component F